MTSVGEQIVDLVTGRISKAEAALIKLRALYAASLAEVENLGADLRVVREQLIVEHNSRMSGMPPAPSIERLAKLDTLTGDALITPIMALHEMREANRIEKSVAKRKKPATKPKRKR